VGLIKSMAYDNRTWGAERIRGELLKLGVQVSKSTIQKYMNEARAPLSPQQTWSTFLRKHAKDIWAVDFLQTHDLIVRANFVFLIIELGSRRLMHFGVTRSPSDAWVARQLREATSSGEGPRFLIRDNDDKYGDAFARVAAGSGIDVLPYPIKRPKSQRVRERFLGSVRRECLDCLLILHERHLYRTVKQCQAYFNHARPHQGIQQRIPCSEQLDQPQGTGEVISNPILGGLHHDYCWQAQASKSVTRAA